MQSLTLYTPGPQIVTHVQEEMVVGNASLPYAPASRDAIIATNREHYARSQTEVEQIVDEQLGHDHDYTHDGTGDGNTPESIARRRLLNLGITSKEIASLLEQHPLSEITDQLDWLPYREARNPARFVVAAIQKRYEPPPRFRPDVTPHADPSKADRLDHLSNVPEPLNEEA